MSPMRLIILLVAAGAAIGAVFLVRSTQAPARAVAAASGLVQPAPTVPMVEVLVARQAIPVGKFVTLDDLKWEKWPKDMKTEAFVMKDEKAGAEAPNQLEGFVGAVARREVALGEPIIADRLVKPGQAGFMAALLSPGMRAVSVQISPESAAGGFIMPDDRVDVLVTREVEVEAGPNGSKTAYRSDMILSNIRVLAIDTTYVRPGTGDGSAPADQSAQTGALDGRYATLELSEGDVRTLAAADRAGRISLILRSVTELDKESGATRAGRVYRDGVAEEDRGVRVYRYGVETARAGN